MHIQCPFHRWFDSYRFSLVFIFSSTVNTKTDSNPRFPPGVMLDKSHRRPYYKSLELSLVFSCGNTRSLARDAAISGLLEKTAEYM